MILRDTSTSLCKSMLFQAVLEKRTYGKRALRCQHYSADRQQMSHEHPRRSGPPLLHDKVHCHGVAELLSMMTRRTKVDAVEML